MEQMNGKYFIYLEESLEKRVYRILIPSLGTDTSFDCELEERKSIYRKA